MGIQSRRRNEACVYSRPISYRSDAVPDACVEGVHRIPRHMDPDARTDGLSSPLLSSLHAERIESDGSGCQKISSSRGPLVESSKWHNWGERYTPGGMGSYDA
jgi:hypothetical protein